MENKLIILLVIVLGAIAVAQLVRIYEISAKLRKNEEHEISNRDNNLNARMMFGFMIVGLIWIITYYVTSAQFPLGAGTPWNLENWNILIGFGIAMVGFMMSTRWK